MTGIYLPLFNGGVLTEPMKITSSATATVERAVTIRMSTETHELLSEVAELNQSTITQVLLGMAEASLDIINTPHEDKIKLPKYLALTRIAKNWEQVKPTNIYE